MEKELYICEKQNNINYAKTMIRLILLTDYTESFSYNLLKGILAYSRQTEPWVICRMPHTYKQTQGMEGVLRWAKAWKADAVIGRFDNDDNVLLLKENGLIVMAQDYKNRFTEIPNITGNYLKAGRMGADFFIRKGFKHFAYYGYHDAVWSQERCEGFRQILAEHGMEQNLSIYDKQSVDEVWFDETPSLLAWLRSLPHPTALMACDDNQGNRITEICKIHNLRVPEQISILGVDNDKIICNISDPPLSSISQNIEKGGYEAAALIERIYKGEESDPQDVVIEPVTIVNRLSTDYYPTNDPYILTVLSYVHQNINRPIHVEDLVKLVPMSRRLLEIRFREATRQSIHQYIATLKMERFAQLLKTTTEPVGDVAAQVGIENLKNLSRQFKTTKGCTPQEYRKLYAQKQKDEEEG